MITDNKPFDSQFSSTNLIKPFLLTLGGIAGGFAIIVATSMIMVVVLSIRNVGYIISFSTYFMPPVIYILAHLLSGIFCSWISKKTFFLALLGLAIIEIQFGIQVTRLCLSLILPSDIVNSFEVKPALLYAGFAMYLFAGIGYYYSRKIKKIRSSDGSLDFSQSTKKRKSPRIRLTAVGANLKIFSFLVRLYIYYAFITSFFDLYPSEWSIKDSILMALVLGFFMGIFQLLNWLHYLGNRFILAGQPLPKSSPKIIAFRSFEDDAIEFEKFESYILSFLPPRNKNFLKNLVKYTERYGKTAIIGDPREILPKAFSSYIYFDDEMWKTAATNYIREASIIIMIPGYSKNIGWELEEIIKENALSKTIFILPPTYKGDWKLRWDRFRATIKENKLGDIPEAVPKNSIVFRYKNEQVITYESKAQSEKAYGQRLSNAMHDILY